MSIWIWVGFISVGSAILGACLLLVLDQALNSFKDEGEEIWP